MITSKPAIEVTTDSESATRQPALVVDGVNLAYRDLFAFRNVIAHGKVLVRKKKLIQHLAEGESPSAAVWDEWWSPYTVKRARIWKKDTTTIAKMLDYAYQRPDFDAEDLKDWPNYKKMSPFAGLGGSSTTLAKAKITAKD